MARAGSYILHVPETRCELLLDASKEAVSIGEPVHSFQHGRAPLVVFASFLPGKISHMADGRKGVTAGTGMVRLNLSNLHEFSIPLSFDEILAKTPPRVRASLKRRFEQGGKLAPATHSALIAAIGELAPEVASRLHRLDENRLNFVQRLPGPARDNLAMQKDSVGLALRFASLDPRRVSQWAPPAADEKVGSFLDGLPQARLREDAMIVHDLDTVPGFEVVKNYPFAARVFHGGGVRLTVILANKLPLEEQFGTDLIYVNETYRAFVMVQYKAMERSGTKHEFRLPNEQLSKEIDRMSATQEVLSRLAPDPSRSGFRLNQCPFFLKLCARLHFDPDQSGLFPGMYLPLDYWQRLVSDEATLGVRGGRRITFENVGRRLSESDFVSLVANAWVGTTLRDHFELTDLVREILETGKTVALAVRSDASRDDPSERGVWRDGSRW